MNRLSIRLLKTVLWTAVLLFAVQAFGLAMNTANLSRAVVFYNTACEGCVDYIEEILRPVLAKNGISLSKHDYINEPQNRKTLADKNRGWKIPPDLRSHLAVFVDDELSLQGHVPGRMLDYIFDEKRLAPDRLMIYQDSMTNPTHYTVWGFRGDPKRYGIGEPISTYLKWYAENKSDLPPIKDIEKDRNGSKITTLVLTTGFLDGINPCAIAVLLFFVAFLFSLNRSRGSLIRVGALYILVIYLTYLGIGVGLLRAFVITGSDHLMAKIGAGLLIVLGLINVKDYFWYGRWVSLGPGTALHQKGKDWLKKATLPSTVVGAFLVGLCTFPCSGGIYVAILGLLSSQTTYWTGMSYLLLYNLAFVTPLIVILLAVSNRRAAGGLSRWQASNKRSIKLVTGALMILLGTGIFFWLS